MIVKVTIYNYVICLNLNIALYSAKHSCLHPLQNHRDEGIGLIVVHIYMYFHSILPLQIIRTIEVVLTSDACIYRPWHKHPINVILAAK